MNPEKHSENEDLTASFLDLENTLLSKGIQPKASQSEPENTTLNLKTANGPEFKLSSRDAVFAEKSLPNEHNVEQKYLIVLCPEGVDCNDCTYHTLHFRNYALYQNETGEISVQPGYMIWATGTDKSGNKARFFYNSLSNGVYPEKKSAADELLKTMSNLVAEVTLNN